MNSAVRGTVVLVNDDQSQLRLASAILEADGLHVSSCENVQQALAHMEDQGAPDVIINTDAFAWPSPSPSRLFNRLRRSEGL